MSLAFTVDTGRGSARMNAHFVNELLSRQKIIELWNKTQVEEEEEEEIVVCRLRRLSRNKRARASQSEERVGLRALFNPAGDVLSFYAAHLRPE